MFGYLLLGMKRAGSVLFAPKCRANCSRVSAKKILRWPRPLSMFEPRFDPLPVTWRHRNCDIWNQRMGFTYWLWCPFGAILVPSTTLLMWFACMAISAKTAKSENACWNRVLTHFRSRDVIENVTFEFLVGGFPIDSGVCLSPSCIIWPRLMWKSPI